MPLPKEGSQKKEGVVVMIGPQGGARDRIMP